MNEVFWIGVVIAIIGAFLSGALVFSSVVVMIVGLYLYLRAREQI